MRPRARHFRCTLVALLALSLPAPALQASEPQRWWTAQGEGEGEALDELIHRGARAYEIGDLAASDSAWARVRALDPEHPAAPIFELRTLQARRSLDYWGGEYEPAIRERADEALRLSRAWLERAPDSPQAHFYLGQALLEMMVIDGMAKQFYKAGSQGEEARKHLERALELDPGFVDAKLPLGTYYYYGSIATRYVPFLRWLWFVPQGDHDVGLSYIQEVARKGNLLKSVAANRLAGLYLYVEKRPDLAEPIFLELSQTFPENSALHFELIEARLERRDYAGTVAAALAFEQTQGNQFGDEARRRMARLWRARAELYRGRTKEADALLRSLEAQFDELSAWSQRWLLVTRGQLHDVTGERDEAVASYARVSQDKVPFGSRRSADIARNGLDTPFELDVH